MIDSGKMDRDYMDYLVKVLYKAKAYGFKCFLDPHQDVVRLVALFPS